MSDLNFYDLTYEGPVVQAILGTAQKLRTDGYIFIGAGTPETVPGTPTERVWYLCGPGTYANFGTSVTVPAGSVMVAQYASGWTKTVIEVTSGGSAFATGEEVEDVSLFDSLNDLEGKTDEQKHAMIPDGNAVEEIVAGVDVNVDIIEVYNTPLLTGTCGNSYKDYKVSAGSKIYEEDIIVTKLIFNENISSSESNTTVTYYVANPNTTSLGTSSQATIIAGTNYADVNIEVPAGKLIYVQNRQIVSGGSSQLTGCLVAISNTDTSRGQCYTVDPYSRVVILYGGFSYEIKKSIPIRDYVDMMDATINKRIDDYHNGRVGYDDAKTVCVFGSSFTDQRYAPAGHIWLEEINHLCDVNIVNFAFSGHNLKNNMDNCLAISKRFDWIFWNNEANGTPYGYDGYVQLKNAKEITDEKAAYMLLGGENETANTNIPLKSVDKCFDVFADEHCIPRSELRRELVSTGQTYGGFDSGSHRGWRTQAPYIAKHLELLGALPIMKSMKLFKLRPSSLEKTIAELSYDTYHERSENFYAVSTGVADGGSFSDKPFYAVDNIDNANYDIEPAPTIQTIRARETDVFRNGGTITINEGTALLEIITEKTKVSKGTLSFICSASPTVFVANCHNASTTYTDSPRSTWVEVTDKIYVDNVLTCNLSGDISLADKVRVLIVVGESFTMSKPVFENYNGKDKKVPENTYHARQYGTECNDNLYVATGWTLGGNASVKQVPSAIGLYAAGTSHIELPDNNSTAEKTITIPSGTRKVAVRVMAQKFYKIMTTRYEGGEYADSEYVSTEQIINNYDNDLGLIDIYIDDAAVSRQIVCPGFAWSYVEYSPDLSSTTLKVKIKRRDADEAPIMVYQVSVQVIE